MFNFLSKHSKYSVHEKYFLPRISSLKSEESTSGVSDDVDSDFGVSDDVDSDFGISDPVVLTWTFDLTHSYSMHDSPLPQFQSYQQRAV